MEDAEILKFDLESELYNRYTDIAYEEISVQLNINLEDALRRVATKLLERKMSFLA